MLLLSLSIFFHYDLLHCGQGNANGKEEFMDYGITEFWWNATLGINQTDRITPQNTFLPTPDGWTTPEDFPMEPPTSYELEMSENDTVVTPSSPRPWHIKYPGLTPPPNFPSDYRFPTTYPYTESANISSPTGPTPKKPSFPLPEVDRPTFPSLTTLSPEEEHVKKWQQEIHSHAAAVLSTTPTNLVPKISHIFNYDYTTEGFPDAFRRVSKTTEDPISTLKNNVFEDAAADSLRKEIIELLKEEARNSEIKNRTLLLAQSGKNEASLHDPSKETTIQSANNTQTFTTATMQSRKTDFISVSIPKIVEDLKKTTPRKNISGFLRVVDVLYRPAQAPATVMKEEWGQSVPTVPMTLTTVMETLRLIPATQSDLEMIEALQEGYMMVFLKELTLLISTKEGKAVRDVVKHADQIINGFYQSGQLYWFGNSLMDVTMKVARSLKKLKMDVIQKHAANLHHMLSQRHQKLSVEVNTILEYADMLYEDDEGRLLFEALKEFAAFPNISLTGYWVCNSLIHNFLRPYRRLKDSQQRQELMDSVNLVLKTRLSSIGLNEEPPLRDGDVKRADSPPDGAKLSTIKELMTRTVSHSGVSLPPRERKRKRHHRSHKRKKKRKRFNTDLT